LLISIKRSLAIEKVGGRSKN